MRGLSHSSNSVTGISSTAVTPSSLQVRDLLDEAAEGARVRDAASSGGA